MSGLELLVIAIGAPAGYWLVSFLLRGAKPSRPQPPAQPPDAPAPGWHEVLGVTQQAGVDEIRAAYRQQLTQYHPDKVAALGPELRELANRKSQAITQAYREAMAARGEAA